jgi:hypothetical protein
MGFDPKLRNRFGHRAVRFYGLLACCAFFFSMALIAAPNLTGKRFTIVWRDDETTNEMIKEVAFTAGKAGAPVSATLLNPTEGDVKYCPDLTYYGTYSSKGHLELMLKPASTPWVNSMVLQVDNNYDMTGTWMAGVNSFVVSGKAVGKCRNKDGSREPSWTYGAISVSLIIFLLWASTKAESKPKSGGGKGSADDPSNPWNDLRKTGK